MKRSIRGILIIKTLPLCFEYYLKSIDFEAFFVIKLVVCKLREFLVWFD